MPMTVVLIVLVVLIIVFTVQNALPVTITLLAWQFNAPLAVVIMLSVLAGAALMALVLFATGIKKSIDKRRAAARKGPGDQA